MQITHVREELYGQGLNPPELNVLVPNESNYSTLLFQPRGRIMADSNGVRNTETDHADQQFKGFVTTALDKNVDLAITPEYSFPWQTLEQVISDGQVPNLGQLWIFGCESIQPDELTSLRDRLQGKAVVIHERVEQNDARFLNPVTYVFQTATVGSDEVRVVALIQFKTFPMGDDDHFEINGMIRGTRLFQFGGTDSQLRLITLICSDAFAFSQEDARQLYDRTLVIHIQLNQDPRNPLFRLYRTHLFMNTGKQTEVIALNWARDIEADVGRGHRCWNNISGSGWYLRPDRFDQRETTFQENHRLGLYYTWLKSDRCHALFFAYDPAMFLVTATKVAHIGVTGPISRCMGPKMLAMYEWNESGDEWAETEANDRFSDIAGDAGTAEADLVSLARTEPLAVERIVAICAGDPVLNEQWYATDQLDSMTIDTSEIVKRVTCCHDACDVATRFRRARLRACQRATRLLNEPLPPALLDFEGGFKYAWQRSQPHCNAISECGRPATVIALDDNHTSDDADRVKTTVAELLMRHAGSDDDAREAAQRLHVWYREDDGQDALCRPHEFIQIDQSPQSPLDIGRQS